MHFHSLILTQKLVEWVTMTTVAASVRLFFVLLSVIVACQQINFNCCITFVLLSLSHQCKQWIWQRKLY